MVVDKGLVGVESSFLGPCHVACGLSSSSLGFTEILLSSLEDSLLSVAVSISLLECGPSSIGFSLGRVSGLGSSTNGLSLSVVASNTNVGNFLDVSLNYGSNPLLVRLSISVSLLSLVHLAVGSVKLVLSSAGISFGFVVGS